MPAGSIGWGGSIAARVKPVVLRQFQARARVLRLEHRPPYALRHTFASFAIQAGVPLFHLARFMGTSVEQIDRTYGHLLPDSLELARGRLDVFLAASDEAREGLGL